MAESARAGGRKRRRPWIQLAVLSAITHSVATAAPWSSSSSSSGSSFFAGDLEMGYVGSGSIASTSLLEPSQTSSTAAAALSTIPLIDAPSVRPTLPPSAGASPTTPVSWVTASVIPAMNSDPDDVVDTVSASDASGESTGDVSGSSDVGASDDGSNGFVLPPYDGSHSSFLPPMPGPPMPIPMPRPPDRPIPGPPRPTMPFPLPGPPVPTMPPPTAARPVPTPPRSPKPKLPTPVPLPPSPSSPSSTSIPMPAPMPMPTTTMPKPVKPAPTKSPTVPPVSPGSPPPPQTRAPGSGFADLESPPPPSYLPPPLQPPSPIASPSPVLTPSPGPTSGGASGSDDSDDGSPAPPSRTLPPLRASPRPTSTPEGRATVTPEPQDPLSHETPEPSTSKNPSQAPRPPSSPQPESSRRYQRGDDVVRIDVVSSGSGSTVLSPRRIVIAPSQAPAVVIGGNDDSVSTNSGASSESEDPSDVYSFLQYLTSIAALVSILWLAGCQVFAAVSRPAHAISDPNQWEFGLFASYVQALGSSSQLIVSPNIPRFVLRFMDAYSWTVFLPLHGNSSGITTSGTSEGRRLDHVVLDGLVAFADRVGIQESDLVSKATLGFVVVMAALFAVLVAFYLIPKCMATPKSVEDTESRAPTGTTVPADGISTGTTRGATLDEDEANTHVPALLVGGLIVSVWFFSLYPLTLVSSYEISAEARSSINGSSLAIATLVIACFCLTGLVFAIAMIWRLRSDNALSSTRHLAMWGSLYAGTRPPCRLFFVAFALNQVLRGVIVGSVVDDTAQLASLIAFDVAVLAAVCLLRPFESASLLTPFICAIYGVRVLNTSLGFAFARSSSGYASRRAVGIAFIAINSAVVLLWFARHFGMVCRLVRRSIAAHRRRHPQPVKTPTGSPHVDAAYTSIDERDEEAERIYRQFANRRDSW